MKPFSPPADYHPADCRCGLCEHMMPGDRSFADAFGLTVRELVIGMALGLVIAILLDRATGGPGLGVIFGWGS